jgi:uncharacterized membrane protein YccC
MNAELIDPTTLDRCTRAADLAVDAALRMVLMLCEAQATGDPVNVDQLRDASDVANDAAQATFRALREAGGQVPAMPERRAVPLHLLSTDASRRLLEALRQAQECAEAVDAERGNSLPAEVPLQPGESRGTGYAETLSSIVQQLALEVEGPRDLRQGKG